MDPGLPGSTRPRNDDYHAKPKPDRALTVPGSFPISLRNSWPREGGQMTDSDREASARRGGEGGHLAGPPPNPRRAPRRALHPAPPPAARPAPGEGHGLRPRRVEPRA